VNSKKEKAQSEKFGAKTLHVCSHLLTLVPLLADFATLMMEAIRSSEKSVHTRSTRRDISEDGILQTDGSPKSTFSYLGRRKGGGESV
jgi:hypothetical protein